MLVAVREWLLDQNRRGDDGTAAGQPHAVIDGGKIAIEQSASCSWPATVRSHIKATSQPIEADGCRLLSWRFKSAPIHGK
ncbi:MULTISPECIES: hypothetical protein [unclassified Methylobacterium]|uniref:hypothetical protein n=1 Tax=unclassified Methylobacterium TaxID=2615210 RepID=UPI001650173E|nr:MULTISPECIES: hypothetical protein [unclassified Methylobacterium]